MYLYQQLQPFVLQGFDNTESTKSVFVLKAVRFVIVSLVKRPLLSPVMLSWADSQLTTFPPSYRTSSQTGPEILGVSQGSVVRLQPGRVHQDNVLRRNIKRK